MWNYVLGISPEIIREQYLRHRELYHHSLVREASITYHNNHAEYVYGPLLLHPGQSKNGL